jgi:hypothetical protein
MLRAIYYYAIAFITLMMVIGGSISVFSAAADLATPGIYISSQADYKNMGQTQKYADYVAQTKESDRKRALNSLIRSFGFIVIPGPIFLFTNRRIKEMDVKTT